MKGEGDEVNQARDGEAEESRRKSNMWRRCHWRKGNENKKVHTLYYYAILYTAALHYLVTLHYLVVFIMVTVYMITYDTILYYSTLHTTTPHYTAPYYTLRHYSTLQFTQRHTTALHYLVVLDLGAVSEGYGFVLGRQVSDGALVSLLLGREHVSDLGGVGCGVGGCVRWGGRVRVMGETKKEGEKSGRWREDECGVKKVLMEGNVWDVTP